MKLPSKVRYGLRVMIEIGLHDSRTPVFQKEIAKNQNLSGKYLDAIVSALKASGLIVNAGGKKSSYLLSKPASEINVYMIFKTFISGQDIVVSKCNPCNFDINSKCPSHDFWAGLDNTIINYLTSTTLETLVDKQKRFIENFKS
jgi:Rrf2 family protein